MALNQKVTEIARQKIGQYLKEIRKFKKLTILEMAEKTGTGVKTISAIENGNTNYTIDAFIAYVDAINLKVSFENKVINDINFKIIDTKEKTDLFLEILFVKFDFILSFTYESICGDLTNCYFIELKNTFNNEDFLEYTSLIDKIKFGNIETIIK